VSDYVSLVDWSILMQRLEALIGRRGSLEPRRAPASRQDASGQVIVGVPSVVIVISAVHARCNARFVGDAHVITSPDDWKTQAVAEEMGASVYLTTAWKSALGPFDKGAALNEWLDHIATSHSDGWVGFLDADIALVGAIDCAALQSSCLYSAPRRLCKTIQDWREFKAGSRALDTLPIDVPPVIGGRVWGDKETANPAGLCGYCQIWNVHTRTWDAALSGDRLADRYDVEIALSFDEECRSWLPGVEVVHLGPLATNWQGRRSPRWRD
jgi:hypothetical protein